MPIIASDIKLRLSGGAANANPLLSIGGPKSSVDWGTDIFDTVESAESAAGDTEYRCVYVHNNHGSLSMLSPVLWITVQTPSPGTVVAAGAGAAAVNATETAIANENTAPAGVVFTEPSSEGTAITLADIPFGQHKAVWVRRTVTAGAAAYTGDGFTLRVKCDTLA